MVAGSRRIPDRLDFAGVRLMIEHPIADDTPTPGKQATPLIVVRPLVRVHLAHSVLKKNQNARYENVTAPGFFNAWMEAFRDITSWQLV